MVIIARAAKNNYPFLRLDMLAQTSDLYIYVRINPYLKEMTSAHFSYNTLNEWFLNT